METLKQLALAGFIFACIFMMGFGIRDQQWEVKHNDYILDQEEKAKKAQDKKDLELANIGFEHEQELENERKTISDLRAGLRDGTIRMRQAEAQCRAIKDQRTSMDDGERAESGDSEQELGQDILDLAEYAKTAIAQRDALQESIDKFNEGVE